jgi:hypothetical protein
LITPEDNSVRGSDGVPSERGRFPEEISLSPGPEIQDSGKLHSSHTISSLSGAKVKKHRRGRHFPHKMLLSPETPGRTQKSIKTILEKQTLQNGVAAPTLTRKGAKTEPKRSHN